MITVMIADDDNKPYRIRRRTLLREARRGQYLRSEGCPAVNYTKNILHAATYWCSRWKLEINFMSTLIYKVNLNNDKFLRICRFATS